MYYSREDLLYLADCLRQHKLEANYIAIRRHLRKALLAISTGQTSNELLAEVVKLLVDPDLVTKKLAHEYITHPNQDEELLLLAVNTLLRDCRSANPTVRGLAIKTVTSLPQVSILQYGVEAVLRCMKDPSAYVRRCSVLGCLRLYNRSADLIQRDALIEDLYSMIRDADPLVVVNSLEALNSILAVEGGMVVNRNIATYLLKRLSMFTDFGLLTVLELLQRYIPDNEDEVLDVMNLCDFTLTHTCISVIVTALGYFVNLTQNMPHLRGVVFQRTTPVLLSTLGGEQHELIYSVLRYIEENFLKDFKQDLQMHHKNFFCRHDEPIFVKTQRLKILPQLICSENVEDILDELTMNCKDRDLDVSQISIQALGQMATMSNLDELNVKCLDTLLNLLTPRSNHVISQVLQVLQNVTLNDAAHNTRLCDIISECDYLELNIEGKCAFYKLLAEHGENIENAPYILEAEVNELHADATRSVILLTAVLTSSIKLLIKRPAEMQNITGQVMELCVNQNNHSLTDKTHFYYRLLREHQEHAEQVIL